MHGVERGFALTVRESIIVGIAAILMYICYHPPTFEMLHERKSKKQLLKDWDYVGMVLWATGWTLFLLGLSWGGGVSHGLFPNHPQWTLGG